MPPIRKKILHRSILLEPYGKYIICWRPQPKERGPKPPFLLFLFIIFHGSPAPSSSAVASTQHGVHRPSVSILSSDDSSIVHITHFDMLYSVPFIS